MTHSAEPQPDFFRGLRWKAGCITLLMALMATGAWLRSDRIVDAVSFAEGNRQHSIISLNGMVAWYTVRGENNDTYFEIATASKLDPQFHWTILEIAVPGSDRQ